MLKFTSPWRGCVLLCCTLAAAAAPGVLRADGAKTAEASSDGIVEPISARDIPARADADKLFLLEVQARARRSNSAAMLDAQLAPLSAGVRDLAEGFRRNDLLSLPVARLESLDRHWSFYDRQLARWQRDQQRALDGYADDAAQLSARRTAWAMTRGTATVTVIAPALLQRVDGLIAGIDAAESVVSVPLGAHLELGRRASSLDIAIDAGKQAVSLAIDNYDRRLARVDAPRYWQMWRDRATASDAISVAIAGIGIEAAFMREYVAASSEKLAAHAIYAVLLLPLLLWLGARSRRLVSDDPELRSSTHALTRPISAWLVLVLLGTLFFEPDAPVLLHEAALLLALIPVLRLLPGHVFDVLGFWPYAATALYLAHRLGFLLVGHPFWHRTHLLAITVLTLVALLVLLLQRWTVKPVSVLVPADTAPSWFTRLRPLLQVAGWAGVAALAVSIVANLFGNVTLSEVLTYGTLTSGYVGLALYAGATALGAIVKLLLVKRAHPRFSFLTQRSGPLTSGLTSLIRLVAAVVWLVVTLNEFRIYRPVADATRSVLTHSFEAGKISITLGSVLLFVLSVYVAFWVARAVRMTLSEEVLPRMELPRGVANSIATLTYYALVMLGLLIALAAAGFHVSQLAIVFGALGVGIGFGLQNVVNNFVSGLILMFERPIQPGDTIDVAGVSGTVRDIGMRATRLESFEGAEIVVPNGMLLSEKLTNWTLSDQNRRVDVNLGIPYGHDPRKVLELLTAVAAATPGVADFPKPVVLFIAFGPSSQDISVRAWTNDFDNWVRIRSELGVRVYEALKAEGIAIPFPQHDLHLKTIAPEVSAQLAATKR